MRVLPYILYPLAEKYQGRNIRPKLQELRQWQQLSFPERARLRRERLIKAIEWAGTTVPYYRDLFREKKIDLQKIAKAENPLEEIPYLTKDLLRENGTRLLSEKIPQAGLHVRRTNGSTGISTEIFYDQNSLDWTAATNFLTYDFTGRNLSKGEIHLSTRFLEKFSRKDAWTEKIKCLALGRTNLHTEDFSETGLKKLLQGVTAAHAYLIQGHPSTLYFLALYARRAGLTEYPLLSAFVSTGETLEPEKADLIEETLGCKVYNRYGNAEFGVVAHSRNDREVLEIFDFNVWPENYDLQGGRKEIVLTGLLNPAMPLLRYRTGDLGEIYKENDQLLLRNILGRVHDLVPIAGKMHPTHFVKDLLERWGGVDEWQIILRHKGPHSLRVVGNAALNKEHTLRQCAQHFGPEYQVEFIGLDQLQLSGWRDKFRYVVKEELQTGP